MGSRQTEKWSLADNFRVVRPETCNGGSCAYSLKSGRVNARVYYAYALRNTKTTTPSVDWSGFQTDDRSGSGLL